MTLQKTAQSQTTPQQSTTTQTGHTGLGRMGTILTVPFVLPATLVQSGFKLKGMDGFLLGPMVLAIAAFFGMAYLLSKKYPSKGVMQKALVVWLVGFLLAIGYLAYQEKQRKEDVAASSSGKLA